MRVITKKIDRRIKPFDDTYYKILAYDTDNLYPQNILKICQGSGTAISCAEAHKDFLYGVGFKSNGDKVIHDIKRTKLNELLESVVNDYSYFWGFAIHVNWNINYKISSIKHIPFQFCRLGIPDDRDVVGKIAVYNNWDRKYKRMINKSHIDYIDVFNSDPEVIKYQVKAAGGWQNYKGQVLYYSAAGENTYPLSQFDPVLEDVETDSKIQLYKYRSIMNSFSAGHMLIWRGKFENEFDEADFEENLKKFMGAENPQSIFLVQLDFDEQEPELKKFEQINTDKLFQYTEKSIQDNIRKRTKIPPVLIGDLIVGRLGTAEEILDATIMYNAFTKRERRKIEEIFSELMKLYKRPVRSNLEIEELTIIDEIMLAKREKQKARGAEQNDDNAEPKEDE